MRIDMPVWDRFENTFTKVLKADIVDVAPHLADVATFAVHLPLPHDRVAGWRVSNVETSATASVGHATRGEAIEAARALLADKTVAQMERAMARQQESWRPYYTDAKAAP